MPVRPDRDRARPSRSACTAAPGTGSRCASSVLLARGSRAVRSPCRPDPAPPRPRRPRRPRCAPSLRRRETRTPPRWPPRRAVLHGRRPPRDGPSSIAVRKSSSSIAISAASTSSKGSSYSRPVGPQELGSDALELGTRRARGAARHRSACGRRVARRRDRRCGRAARSSILRGRARCAGSTGARGRTGRTRAGCTRPTRSRTRQPAHRRRSPGSRSARSRGCPAPAGVPSARTRRGSAMNAAPDARSSGPSRYEKMSA